MVIRPVEQGDLAGLLTLAGETGGGLTLAAGRRSDAGGADRTLAKDLARRAAERRAGLRLRP
nr:Arginine N-succinyltransferase [Raoultella sp. NCTC 9187]